MRKRLLKLYAYNALINFSLVGTILYLYLNFIGLSYAQIGILAAALQFGKCVLEVPTGYIADRFGNKASVIISLLLNIATYIIVISTDSFYVLFVSFVLLAISYTLSTGCVDAIIVNSVFDEGKDDELIKVASISRIIQYVSCGVSSIVACIVAELNFHFAFLIDIFALALCLLLVFSFEDRPNERAERNSVDYSIKTVTKYVISNQHIFYFTLIDSAVAWAMVPVDDFYSNYLSHIFAIPLSNIGFIIAAQFVIVSIVGLFSRKLNDKIGTNVLVRIGPLVMMILFTLFAFTPNPILAITFYILALTVFCLYSPVSYSSMQKSIKSEYRVTVVSFNSLAVAGLSSISSPIMGIFSDKYGMSMAMRILLIVSVLLIGLINFALRKIDFQKQQI